MTALDRERRKAALQRASQIRYGMGEYLKTLSAVAQAWAERDDRTLAYESWQAYIDGEFGAERLKLDPAHREKAVTELRLAGLSQRAIGAALGVSQPTVHRVLSDSNESPAEGEAAGQDVVDAVKQAIVDATERAEDHRADTPGEADGSASAAGSGGWPDPAPSQPDAFPGAPVEADDQPSSAAGAGTCDPAPAPNPGVAAPAEEDAPAAASRVPSDEPGPATETGPGPGSPIDTVVDAIQQIAAETGICPACERPL